MIGADVLLQAIHDQLGPEPRWGQETLTIRRSTVEGEETRIDFTYWRDPDGASQYDKSTTWEGRAVFVAESTLVSASMTVTDSGDHRYHEVGSTLVLVQPS